MGTHEPDKSSGPFGCLSQYPGEFEVKSKLYINHLTLKPQSLSPQPPTPSAFPKNKTHSTHQAAPVSS